MRPVLAPRRLGPAAIAALVIAAACSTRVVDLPLPDAGPRLPSSAAGTGKPDAPVDASAGVLPGVPPRCEKVQRADGATCTLCFNPDGTVTNGSCEPVMMVPPPPVPDAAPAIPVCKVVPRSDLRCRVCSAATGDYTACLTCQEVTLIAGERCRPCVWNDQPEQRCLQCFGADGGVSHDDCDNLRKEVVAPGGV
jgi:hypothetical protein